MASSVGNVADSTDLLTLALWQLNRTPFWQKLIRIWGMCTRKEGSCRRQLSIIDMHCVSNLISSMVILTWQPPW
uniref:O-linked N-acetylglucosamine (GlcNAc) transferase n=1 Tax=Homo sapiens TaxID=9606 RepID=A0A8V8TP98_HUMAN